MSAQRILVSNIMMLNEKPRFAAEIAARGWDPVFPDVDQFLDEAACLRLAGQFDGWLAGDDEVTRRVLEAHLPRLRGIAKWGTGLDSIDLAAASDLGVPVMNSPGAFSEAVAEVAIGYMLITTRFLLTVDQDVRAGSWPKPRGLGLYGRMLGLVGYGAIGQGIAQRARSCGMSVIAHDPSLASARPDMPDVRFVGIDELATEADVVALACNLTADNRHIIDAARLAMMKPEAVVINVGRGPLVDEAALTQALAAGKIAGAGLDVFEIEPLPMNSRLRTLPNVVLGSHNANNLASAVENVHANTLVNLERIMAD